jgi:hypothetical protein
MYSIYGSVYFTYVQARAFCVTLQLHCCLDVSTTYVKICQLTIQWWQRTQELLAIKDSLPPILLEEKDKKQMRFTKTCIIFSICHS